MNINLTTPFGNLLSRSDIPSDLLEIFFQIESITFSGRKYTTIYMNNHDDIKEIGRKHFLIMNLFNRQDVSNDVKDLFNNVFIIRFLDESYIECSGSFYNFHNTNLNFVKGLELYPLFDKDMDNSCNYKYLQNVLDDKEIIQIVNENMNQKFDSNLRMTLFELKY
jgi:hypothetical protein